MKKSIVVFSLGLTATIFTGAHAADLNQTISANNFIDAANKMSLAETIATSPPTCETYNSVPTYYAATNGIKLPWVDLSGDGSNARYCAILRDFDNDGRFELTSFDITNDYNTISAKVVFDEAAGSARVPYILWMAADGSLPYTGSMTLQQESDGQFSVNNLELR